MKKLVPGILALTIFFVSCENKAGNQAPPPSVNLQAPAPVQQQQPQQLPQAQPAQQQPVNITQVQQSQPANGSVALNPKHGQPGHRCDIAEGAPLNSAANPQPVIQTQLNPGVPASQPAAVKPVNSGAVRLNPAHGQPGHDCAIEVGKPLRN
ncbi:MAG: hypothetical protein ACXWB9_02025 [Flavisolibacter sp.]